MATLFTRSKFDLLGGGGDELGELLLHGLICALAEKVGKRKHPENKEAPEGRGFVKGR